MKKVPIGSKPNQRSQVRSADEWIGDAVMPPGAAEPVEPIKRLTIEIPLSLHQKVKLHCVQRGVTMADVIREMLAERVTMN